MFEVLIIVVLLLLIFGAGKVRSAGSDLGAAVKGFRKSLQAPQAQRPATPCEPDAEFPETLAARARGSGKPGAPGAPGA
jgi:sec-independent protein translocase protein TatA